MTPSGTNAPNGDPALLPADLDALLAAAAARVVEGIAPDDFVAWFVAEAGEVAPLFAGTLHAPPDGDPRASFARALWNRFPQPDNRFRPRPLPAPKRNDPCPCGSGRKYKRCCQRFEPSVETMQGLPLLLNVLDRYPDEALDELDPAPMDPDELLHVLETWGQDGDGERVVRLALPMFRSNRRLPRHAPEALEILLEYWPVAFRPETFEALSGEFARSRDEEIASIAVLALVERLYAGDPAAARTLFDAERGRFADHPGFAELEVDLLVAEERPDEAKALAGEWSERLLAIDPGYADLAARLIERAAYVDPELALERACDEDGVLARLVELLEETPPAPIAGSHAPPRASAETASRRALVLTPTPALARVETAWRERVGVRRLREPPEEPPAEPPDPAALVAFLDEEPLALSSFDVLETIVVCIDRLAEESCIDALLLRLLERAEKLLYRHVSREAGFETREGLPDWDAMVWETAPTLAYRHPENRPALDMLSSFTGWYVHGGPPGSSGRQATLSGVLNHLDPDDGRIPELPADRAPAGGPARET